VTWRSNPRPTLGPSIAIVGAGFAGAAFALHFIRTNGDRPVGIDVFEPRPLLGAGLAYSTPDPEHRINIAAARMAVIAEDPTHFDRWFRDSGAAEADPAALTEDGRVYPRRAVFGHYMDRLVRETAGAAPSVAFRHVQSQVSAIEGTGTGYRLTTAAGETSHADLVVLAPGHPPPSRPKFLSDAAAAHPRWIGNPWLAEALAPVRANDDVLIVGTGLTMADVVASLRARGHTGRITAVSRRGLTPRPRTVKPVEAFGIFDRDPTPSIARLLSRVRQAVRRAAFEGRPWECVVDALRQQATPVWQALSPADRRRFLRHLRPYWDAHRYQIAPQLDGLLVDEQRRGRLKIAKAGISALGVFEGSLHARLAVRGMDPTLPSERFFDAVVNCTGPDHASVVGANPALASLAGQGLLRPEPFGLGIEVDHLARVVAANGRPARGLFVAGPLARGYFGELMGLPQVSTQPERLAGYIAGFLGGRGADEIGETLAAVAG
jgi:uncharacterized NAD(P)/FAD-binding protein YdhS